MQDRPAVITLTLLGRRETGSPCSSLRTTTPLWMLVSLLRPLLSRTPYHPFQHLSPLSHRTMSAVIRDQATASFKLVRRPRLDALALQTIVSTD